VSFITECTTMPTAAPRRVRSHRGSITVTLAAYDGGVDALAGIIRETLIVTAVLCFPVLVVATSIGTFIAVLQAATQVQEQTLTLLPKMLAVGAMVALFGAFGLGLCGSLFTDAIRMLPQIVRAAP